MNLPLHFQLAVGGRLLPAHRSTGCAARNPQGQAARRCFAVSARPAGGTFSLVTHPQDLPPNPSVTENAFVRITLRKMVRPGF